MTDIPALIARLEGARAELEAQAALRRVEQLERDA